MKAHAGAINQELSTDMTNAERSTDVLSKRSNDRSEEGQEFAVVLRLDHAMHGKSSASHRKCTARLGMEAWRLLFQAYSRKINARLVVMMLEVLASPLDTNDVVNSLETMERKIERYANIEIPEFLKIGVVIRQAEEGPIRTHLIMNSHRLATFQDGSDERQASPKCSDGKIGRRNGRGCLHERIQVCFQRFWEETGLRGRVTDRCESWEF